jgi:hypothetical protein
MLKIKRFDVGFNSYLNMIEINAGIDHSSIRFIRYVEHLMTVKNTGRFQTIQKNNRDSDTNLLGNAYIRAVNRARIIDLFRGGQLLSRVDLSRHCELSKPTVSAIVDDLITEGVLQELN